MQSSFVLTMIAAACAEFAFSHGQAVGEEGATDVSLLQYTLDVQEQAACSLTPSTEVMTVAPELFGYNQINGVGWQNRRFDDPDLMQIPKAMWSGQLRYPGGTVANYWYLPNATYADTCSVAPPPPAGFSPQCKDNYGEGAQRDRTDRLQGAGGKTTLDAAWNYVQWGCVKKSGGQCFSHESFCDKSTNDWTQEDGACGSYLMGTTCGCCMPKTGNEDGSQNSDEVAGPNAEGVQDSNSLCAKTANVEYHAPMTFSVTNFVNGVGMASPVSAPSGLMYDLNVVTVDKASITSQIDYLHHVSLTGVPVKFIEFGNELFMTDHYGKYFPDAHVYMSKVNEAMIYAKKKLGDHVKVAVPLGFPFGIQAWDRYDDWNLALKAYCEPKCPFDAVTIHDYQANNRSIDHQLSEEGLTYHESQRRSALAAFGEAQVQRHVRKVNEFLEDKNLEIWLTEWSSSAWDGAWLQDQYANGDIYAPLSSNMNGIFLTGYLLSMLPRSRSPDVPLTTGSLHILNGMPYSESALIREVSGGSPATPDYNGYQEISCAAQIVSHVSYIALHLSDGWRSVEVSHCGKLDFDVQGYSSLSCLQAVAFEHSCRTDALPVYVVINRCTESIATSMDTSSHEGTPFRTLSYDSYTHGWTRLDEIEPPSYHHPWRRGPQEPNVTTGVTSASTLVTFSPISLTVVEFASTGASSDCPAVFPEHACDDIAPSYWVGKGTECKDIPEQYLKCNTDNSWLENGYCALTCCHKGLGYSGNPCKCQ